MARDEREQKALDMLNDKSIPTDDIIRYVKGECRDVNFGPVSYTHLTLPTKA